MPARVPRQAKYSALSVQIFGSGFLLAVPIIVSAYLQLVLPFIGDDGVQRPENIFFWPTLAVIVIFLSLSNSALLDREYLLSLPVISLAAYFVLAGVSVTWAYASDVSFSRYVAHLLLAIIVLLPYALPLRRKYTIPLIHGVYLAALAINAYYVLNNPPSPLGHTGYFPHKQELGMFGATTMMLSLHETLKGGWRRIFGLVGAACAVWILLASESKGALAFGTFSILASALILLACKYLRTTPAFVVAGAVVVLLLTTNNPLLWLGSNFYNDPTLTGRTYIWEFINFQISQKEYFGWGFHSFWNVPNSPILTAPGFIKNMPSSHSGYLELKLETGRIGYWIFLVFIYASLHKLEFVRRKDPIRAWLFLSILFYAQVNNLIDSIWLVMNQLWVLYLVIVGETLSFARAAAPAALPARRRAPRSTEPKIPSLAQP
jgi:exopolysaccharide production protein ExoQ